VYCPWRGLSQLSTIAGTYSNRRLEYTRPDGKPKNRWHLREWTFEELERILEALSDIGRIEWNFLNGAWEGPFECTSVPLPTTQALTPALFVHREQYDQ